MTNIRTYDDLVRERKALEAQLEVHRDALETQLEAIKEQLKPVVKVLNTVKKVTSFGDGNNTAVKAALGIGAGLIARKVIKSHWLTSLVVPLISTSVSSLFQPKKKTNFLHRLGATLKGERA